MSLSLDNPAYTIQPIPGKGLGLISTRTLSPGDCIISEPPLLTTATLQNPSTIESDLRHLIKSLPKDSQRTFLSLHNNFPGSTTPFSNIIRSNGYPLGPNSSVGGIFPITSRLNHSCLPNAQHSYNTRLNLMQVHIIKPIQKGEELTLSYIPGGTYSSRQTELKSHFRFTCTCELCNLPVSKRQESDSRLRHAQKLDESIGNSRRVRNTPELALKDCYNLLEIYQDERIADLRLPRLFYDAFQIVAMHSDRARASEFVRLARESRRICEGVESEEVQRLGELIEDPSRFENFGVTSKWKSKIDDVPKDWNRSTFEQWLWRL